MTLYWDPSPIAFELPFIHLSVHWYGIFFGLGLLTSAILCTHLFKKNIFKTIPQDKVTLLIDRIFLYGCLGIVLGARLVHVFFYDWEYYKEAPSHILAIWEGGLASHGGALGLLVALWLVYKYSHMKELYQIRLVQIFDTVALSAFSAAFCIRLGNFFNQEIVGTPTSLWTGVLFGHPLGSLNPIVPRHPVQLYEAISYLIIGLLLLWNKTYILKRTGLGLGLVLTSFFSARFLIEFLKTPQSLSDIQSVLSTGQYLSLPMIFVGIVLILRALNKRQAP